MHCMMILSIAANGLILTPAAIADSGMVTTLNVRYAEAPGVTAGAQSLDIYAPKGGLKLPVLVYVHRGSWSGGDNRAVGAKPEFFTSAGWAFVSINYRLLPEGKHPTNVEDAAHALAWARSNIAKYDGDSTRLFVMGHSAGAHLAALVATDERHLEAAGKSLDIFKGAIPLDTNVYDLPTLMKVGAEVYKKVFSDDLQVWRDASLYYHVVSGKKLPPFLIFYSCGTGVTGEAEVRAEQAEAFFSALREAGASADVFDASDRTHSEIDEWFGKPDDRVTARAMGFLNSLAGKAAVKPAP